MQEKQINFHQLDPTKKQESIDLLKQLQSEESLIIGIEVTDVEMSRYAHIGIDPQHSCGGDSSITAIEMTYRYRTRLEKMLTVFQKCSLVTIRPDIDSVGSMVLVKLYLCDNWKIDGDALLRLMAIANSDRHGSSSKWNKYKRTNYFSDPLYSKFGLPIGLLTAIGDINLDLKTKLKYMEEYILTGTFEKIDRYTANTLKKNENATNTAQVEDIIPNKLVYVESNYRGALGLGYRRAPVVLAKNPNYVFGKQGKIKGVKYTLAQFNVNHINFKNILEKLQDLEPGWGGDVKSIIGSPQQEPSKLSKDQILAIIKPEIRGINYGPN